MGFAENGLIGRIQTTFYKRVVVDFAFYSEIV
jgi:hypothetical protein